MLIGSLVVVLIGDLIFNLQSLKGTYTDGSWVDALWLAGYILFAASALHPSMADVVEPRPVAVTLLGHGRMLLLGTAMIVGPALLLLEHSTTDGVIVVVAVATAVMSALVLGRLSGMVRHLTSDIERREALEQQLAFQAFHDPLTGLANRRRFLAAVSRALEEPGSTAALFLDLDDFKHVNDQLGHDAGDALLLAVGERLLAAVRPGDVVGRLGGDEFAILLEKAETPQVVEAVASRLVESLAAPIDIDGHSVAVSASVGVALRAPDDDTAMDELLRRADVAMYHAKARGKHRWATWTVGMDTPPAGVPSLVRKPISA